MHRETLVVTPPGGPRQAAMTAFPATAARDLSGEILAIAQRCYVTLPAEFRRFADEIAITIQDFPDDETVVEMGCPTRWDLLGLYSGIAVGDKETGTIAPGPDRIFLFAQPIAAYVEQTGERLADVVRHVLIHEIGHHFGLSDDDMDRIEAAANG